MIRDAELVVAEIGNLNQMLNKNILNIWEILDDFIYLVQAQSALDTLEE